ncbi:MAG TPA: energy-coupling factor ABC transporter permease [Anaerolineae bacterium]|jgi:cobalt/nickel transport system permease protein|nr:energy-coupling factor ABC transporter permease [Anaerolineae bacterium]
MKRYLIILALTVSVVLATPAPAYAMHISEGILPLPWAILWCGIVIPFIAKGISDIRRRSKYIPAFMPLSGMVSAGVFIISALPIPIPVAGTCSHPAGTGLAAILIGPFATVVAGSVSLLIQALFLAHGGITTWGANIFSMGVVGAFSGYFVFRVLVKLKFPLALAAFMAGLVSDWATYMATAFELALGLNNGEPFFKLFKAISIAFIPTQLPIGILEGFAAAGFFVFVLKRRPDILVKLGIIQGGPHVPGSAVYEEAVF